MVLVALLSYLLKQIFRAWSSDLLSVSAAQVTELVLIPLFLSIEVKDISLTDYINVNHAVYVPHTAGRWAKKQFAKGRMPIVERLVNA